MKKKKALSYVFIFLIVVAAPFAPELVILANAVGAEFAILSLAAYLLTHYKQLTSQLTHFHRELTGVLNVLGSAYLFRPKIYFSHVVISYFALLIFGSALLMCTTWLPVILISLGAFGPTP